MPVQALDEVCVSSLMSAAFLPLPALLTLPYRLEIHLATPLCPVRPWPALLRLLPFPALSPELLLTYCVLFSFIIVVPTSLISGML